jgi:Flp pilus assembly protein TadG
MLRSLAMNPLSGFRHQRLSAQGGVEFGVVFFMFFLLRLGIIEFSYALYTQNVLGHAANEGARRGMVLTRIDNAFTQDGNRPGSYLGLSACDPATIVGTVRCRLGAVDTARTTAILDTPSPGGRVIPGLKIAVSADRRRSSASLKSVP